MAEKKRLQNILKADDLSPKQKKVIEGITAGKTRKQAALDAGYAPSCASPHATNLFKTPGAQDYYKQLMALRFEAEDELVQKWKNEVALLAFTDRTKIIEKIQSQKLTYVEFEDWPEDIKVCVKGIRKMKDDGMEVMFESKLDALEKLGKHLGLYEKDNRQKDSDAPAMVLYMPDNGRDIKEKPGN